MEVDHNPDDIIAWGWDDWCFWSDYKGDRGGEDHSIIKFESENWFKLVNQ